MFENIWVIGGRHDSLWRDAMFRAMFGSDSFWAGRGSQRCCCETGSRILRPDPKDCANLVVFYDTFM